MPRGDAPNVHQTQPWYNLWPGKPKPCPCRQPGAALSHRNRFTPPPRTANIYTASHAADEIGVDQAQVHAQALSKSRTDLLAQSRKSLPRGSDNVSATTCDAARDHRQPPHAERAVLSKLVAPVELRTGYVEVRLAADRSGACPRGGLERLNGTSRSRPSSDEVQSLLHTAHLTQSD